MTLAVSKIHDLMWHASLVFGESATMCSEGAILGVPGVYVDPVGRGYTREQQEKYGLVNRFGPDEEMAAINQGRQILEGSTPRQWRLRRERLLSDTIDVTAMIMNVATDGQADAWEQCPGRGRT